MTPANSPTPGAMSAAREIARFCPAIGAIQNGVASIIDRETGLPELVAACEEMLENPNEKCFFWASRLRAAIRLARR